MMQPNSWLNTGGKCNDGDEALSGGHRPLFTIVTAVFNAATDLERTIRSVASQNFNDIEYIVVDGGSSDGTMDIVRRYEAAITVSLSEPDEGVYDAFNKAAKLIRGKWVLFLGAGDTFCNTDVLQHVAHTIQRADADVELVYGRVNVVGRHGTLLKTLNRPWDSMRGRWLGGRPMLPHHQGVFHHRDLFNTSAPFDTSYRIAADSKLMYASIQRHPPLFSEVAVASVSLGGISTNPRFFLSTANEIVKINREFGFRRLGHQAWFYLKALTKYAIFRVAGDGMSKSCIDRFRLLTGREAKWSQ